MANCHAFRGFIQIIDVVLKFGPTLRAVFSVAPVFRMEITAVCLYRVCNSVPLSDSFQYDTMVILTRLFHLLFWIRPVFYPNHRFRSSRRV